MTILLFIGLYYIIGLECTFQYYKRANKLEQGRYSEIRANLIDPFKMPLQWSATFGYGAYLVVKNLISRAKSWYRRRLDLYYGRINSYRVKY